MHGVCACRGESNKRERFLSKAEVQRWYERLLCSDNRIASSSQRPASRSLLGILTVSDRPLGDITTQSSRIPKAGRYPVYRPRHHAGN